jgi:hypothetical protein
MGPVVGFNDRQKGISPMFALNSARHTATAFAGAFITALLFVSAATSVTIA